MISAVDTNIILDILIPGEPFGVSSKKLLDRHLSKGSLIIGEVVFAELASNFQTDRELGRFISETGIRLVHSNERSLYEAGARWVDYSRKSKKNRFSCGQCGHFFEVECPRCAAALEKRLHVLADFLIGAHALANADCLLSRDFGVYKQYFSELRVVGSV
jgi:predicted nucleic acid-binding protein